MECKLCGGRGYVLEYPGVMGKATKLRLLVALEDSEVPIFERGVEAVTCPACKAPDVRAMLWAAVVEGLGFPLGISEITIAENVRRVGDALWEEWKRAHEPE